MANDRRIRPDTDMDGIVDATQDVRDRVAVYGEQLATQLRKGFLAYCVLKVCSRQPKYTSDIIAELREAEMVVVEGTIYPLLSRLQKDGLLVHEWQESEQGPPRKYYKTTGYGDEVISYVADKIMALHTTLKKL